MIALLASRNPPRAPANSMRASGDGPGPMPAFGVELHDAGRGPARVGREPDLRVAPSSLQDRAPGTRHERAHPVAQAGAVGVVDLERGAEALGTGEQVVPADRLGGVETGPLGRGAAIPEQLRIEPPRRRHHLVVVGDRLDGFRQRAAGHLRFELRRHSGQVARGGHLGGEGRVEAQDVDLVGAAGQLADDLAASLVDAGRELLELDRVTTLVAARIGDRAGIDPVGQHPPVQDARRA